MPEIVSVDDGERPESPEGIQQTLLVDGERMNAQHVRFAPGASAGAHSHPHEQVTYAERGETVLIIDGEEHHLTAGDSVLVPGGATHSAENRGDEPSVLIDVFSPVREDLVGE